MTWRATLGPTAAAPRGAVFSRRRRGRRESPASRRAAVPGIVRGEPRASEIRRNRAQPRTSRAGIGRAAPRNSSAPARPSTGLERLQRAVQSWWTGAKAPPRTRSVPDRISRADSEHAILELKNSISQSPRWQRTGRQRSSPGRLAAAGAPRVPGRDTFKMRAFRAQRGCHADSPRMGRGATAAATWISRGRCVMAMLWCAT